MTRPVDENDKKKRNVYKWFIIAVVVLVGRFALDKVAKDIANEYYAEDIAAREVLVKQSITGIRMPGSSELLTDKLEFKWSPYNTRNWRMEKESVGSNEFSSDYEPKYIITHYRKEFLRSGWGEFTDNTPPNQQGGNIWRQKYRSKKGEFLKVDINFDDAIAEPMNFSDNYPLKKRSDGKKTKYYINVEYYDRRD